MEENSETIDYVSEKKCTGTKLTLIITGIVFGFACALALALIPLYLSKNDPLRSNENSMYSFRTIYIRELMHFTVILATTLWLVQLKTNYHLGETRALAAISRTGLATAVYV